MGVPDWNECVSDRKNGKKQGQCMGRFEDYGCTGLKKEYFRQEKMARFTRGSQNPSRVVELKKTDDEGPSVPCGVEILRIPTYEPASQDKYDTYGGQQGCILMLEREISRILCNYPLRWG
jgi:hypothetical protein